MLVNNAGIFRTKPFTDFTTEDFNALVSTNLLRFLLHHSAHRERDAETEIGERCEHHCGTCRSSNRRYKWLSFDDYKGRLEFSNPESRNRVCKRWHPLQCRGTRRCGYTNAQGCSQGLGVAANYENGDGKGCCRCRSLPGTSRSCKRRDPPRGWCCSRSSLVAAR